MYRTALALALALTTLHCGDGADEKENPANAQGTITGTGLYSDAQLLGIARATSTASSAMADAANQRITNAAVQTMVTTLGTNAAADTRALDAFANAMGINAEESAASRQIAADSTTQGNTIRAFPDTGFDDAYLASVTDAQGLAAANFAQQYVNSSSDTNVRGMILGMQRSLAYDAGYSSALEGDYDATDFLAANSARAGVGATTAGAATPGSSSGTGGTTGGSTDTGTGTGTDTGTGLGGDGTATGTGQDPGAGVGTGQGGGTGTGTGLGGDGTDTGTGQSPGGAVGTGTPNTP